LPPSHKIGHLPTFSHLCNSSLLAVHLGTSRKISKQEKYNIISSPPPNIM
jgi:hypothetical protein